MIPRTLLPFVLVVLIAALAGCYTGINPHAIKGTTMRLIERHAAYTEADETLDDYHKELNLRDGAVLTTLLEDTTNDE